MQEKGMRNLLAAGTGESGQVERGRLLAPRRVRRWPGDCGGGAVEGGSGGGRSGEDGERGRHESDNLERERALEEDEFPSIDKVGECVI